MQNNEFPGDLGLSRQTWLTPLLYWAYGEPDSSVADHAAVAAVAAVLVLAATCLWK
jgi:hypothetical protein